MGTRCLVSTYLWAFFDRVTLIPFYRVGTLYSMQRLRDGRPWSVFDPATVPSLSELVGTDFTASYVECESSGLAVRVYDVDVLWAAVVDSQRETGGPFIVFQDNVNGMLPYCVVVQSPP